MQKQHQQLHTQEKILRYELAQKRKLLNELKEELEYCREKWLQAREKNSTTEEQWKQLRTEFALRKNTNSEDLNNSVESGYSDERESSSSDEDDNSETMAGTSGLVKNVKVDEIIDNVAKELEEVEIQSTNVTEDKDQTILEVIKDEIAKIESGVQPSEENKNVKELQVCSSSALGKLSVQQEEDIKEVGVVLNDNTGSTDIVHSNTTLKTDLVQTKEVQKDTKKTPEEIFAAREERLKRLEQQANDLVAQTASTSNRSVEMCAKLDDLHEQYGNGQDSRRKDIDDTYRRLEADILQTIKKTQNGDEYPSSSKQTRITEELLAAREERLKLLEEQSNQLMDQASGTSHRNNEISSKLDSLHQLHGEDNNKSIPNQEMVKNEPNTSASLMTEEILARREERLQMMEEQARELVRNAIRNSWRGLQFSRKLTKLHDRYGESSDSSDEGADDGNADTNADTTDRHSEKKVDEKTKKSEQEDEEQS